MTAIFFTLAAAILLCSLFVMKYAMDTKKAYIEKINYSSVLTRLAYVYLERAKRTEAGLSFGTLPSGEELTMLLELAKKQPMQRTFIADVLDDVLKENNVTL